MARAAVGEVPRRGGMLVDDFALAPVGLVAPHAGLVPVQQFGQNRRVITLAAVATTEWMVLRLLSTPRCAFIPKYHC